MYGNFNQYFPTEEMELVSGTVTSLPRSFHTAVADSVLNYSFYLANSTWRDDYYGI